MRILIWTFCAAAITMCVIAAVMLARTWRELIWVSAFLGVFALTKIALANGLFYIMMHCDTDRREASPAPPPVPGPKRRAIMRVLPRRPTRAPQPVTATSNRVASAPNS